MKYLICITIYLISYSYSIGQSKILLNLVVREDSELNQIKDIATKEAFFDFIKTKVNAINNIILDSNSSLAILCDYSSKNLLSSHAGFMSVKEVKHTIRWQLINLHNEQVYTSKFFSEKTSGYKEENLDGFINALYEADISFDSFINSGVEEYYEYYNNNCKYLIADANKYKLIKDYPKALHILDMVPKNTVCSSQVDKLEMEILLVSQKDKEIKVINDVYKKWLNKNYEDALISLNSINYLSEEKKLLKREIMMTITQEREKKNQLELLEKEKSLKLKDLEIQKAKNDFEKIKQRSAQVIKSMQIKSELVLQRNQIKKEQELQRNQIELEQELQRNQIESEQELQRNQIRKEQELLRQQLKSNERLEMIEAVENLGTSLIETVDVWKFFKILKK